MKQGFSDKNYINAKETLQQDPFMPLWDLFALTTQQHVGLLEFTQHFLCIDNCNNTTNHE